MTTTPYIGLPELAQQQANADITHNEALILIQAVALNGVIDKDLNTPPVSPAEGDAYIVADGSPAASGAWTGWENHVAVYYGGSWRFVPGRDNLGAVLTMGADQIGLRAYVRDEGLLYVWTGSPPAWTALDVGALLAANNLSDLINVATARANLGISATNTPFTPAGNIAATDVQAALAELDNEKVAKAGDTMTGNLLISSTSAINMTSESDSNTSITNTRASSSISGVPRFHMQKCRGTLAAKTAVTTGDFLGDMRYLGYDGVSSFREAANVRGVAIAATPSATDMEGRVVVNCSPTGTVAATEVSRFDHASGFSMYGANPVIDQDRVFRRRVYTVATLPANVQGKSAHVSDALGPAFGAAVVGGGAVSVPVYNTGAGWFVG